MSQVGPINTWASQTIELKSGVDGGINKYHPGKQPFKLVAVLGVNPIDDNSVGTYNINMGNLMNKDSISFNPVKISSVILLEIPREVTRNYPTKFIPDDTRFILSFNSGDVTKPVIVGGEFV